ncbi:Hypothetical predicted protein [Cloeon dipterum]|uniref:Uncharacterized protein n=1 Tax=Cloeon dipterum TaxID=197152 RepID=A0A8S1CVL0_9INSE|nr:Hypothetical predicted protein [Cloeon dipterum]
MKAIILLAAVAVAAVMAVPVDEKTYRTPATTELLKVQKTLLKLFWRVQDFNTYTELVEVGKSYKLEEDIDSYKSKEYVKDFLIAYKKGMLPRGDIFSVFYEPHRKQMIKLFDLFYFAKDYETLYKVACWARDRVNEYMFVYALSVAVYHRADMRGIVLPPFYEIFPQKFVDSEVVFKAYHEYMNHKNTPDYTVSIPVSNYTEFWYQHDLEQRVAYFSEDLGISMHNKFIQLEFPFWMDAKKYSLTLDRKGELYYWIYDQLLARYDLERVANYLPEIEEISFVNREVKHGYNSHVSYMNGVDFPIRPDNMHIEDLEDMTVEDVLDYERRIREAIDLGYFFDREGNKITLKDNKGIDWVGRLIYGFPDVPTTYYGNLTTYAFALVSHIVDPLHKLGAAPGLLEHAETAPRDPAFYGLHKNLNKLFVKYKEHLAPYKREDLVFPGVKVENVEVDKLITYFEDFEFDLYSVFAGTYESDKNVNIKYRVPRLNHKTFNYKFDVTSDKEQDVIVRIFLGPKYDVYGKELTLNEKRTKMIEMDKFKYSLTSGKTVVTRSSEDAFLTYKDEWSTKSMIEKVEEAIEGKTTLYKEETYHCGFPERLLLPRGRKGGMPFSLFVMVSPYESTATESKTFSFGYCSAYDRVYPDVKPFGYPFDRKISEYDFNTPNIFFKDVIIFHKTLEEINRA